MLTTTFTELRKNAAHYFNAVENGEEIMVIRHGKPIAKIIPIDEEVKEPSWKKRRKGIKLKGISISEEILKDRKESKS